MEGRWLCALVDAWLIGQQMPTLPFHLSACLVSCPTHRNPLRLHVMYYTCAHPLHEGRSWGCSHVSKGAILAGDGGLAGWCGHGDAAVNPTAPRASSYYVHFCLSPAHEPRDFSRDVAVQELHLVLTFLIPIP